MPREDDRIYRLLKQYRGYAVPLSITVAAALLLRNHIARAVAENPVSGATAIALFAATLIWYVAYVNGSHYELEMLQDLSVATTLGTWNWFPLLLIFLAALIFGALFAFVLNTIIYCLLASVLVVISAIGFSLVQRSIFLEFGRSNRHPALPRPIAEYYLKNPVVAALPVMMLGFEFALGLALVSKYMPTWSMLRTWSNIIVVLTILGNESLFYVWRKRTSDQSRSR